MEGELGRWYGRTEQTSKERQSSRRVRKRRTALEETGCGLEQSLQSWGIPIQDLPATVTTDEACVQLARFPSSVLHLQEEVSIPLDTNGLDVYCYCWVIASGEWGSVGVIISFLEPELQALAGGRGNVREGRVQTRHLLRALLLKCSPEVFWTDPRSSVAIWVPLATAELQNGSFLFYIFI